MVKLHVVQMLVIPVSAAYTTFSSSTEASLLCFWNLVTVRTVTEQSLKPVGSFMEVSSTSAEDWIECVRWIFDHFFYNKFLIAFYLRAGEKRTLCNLGSVKMKIVNSVSKYREMWSIYFPYLL